MTKRRPLTPGEEVAALSESGSKWLLTSIDDLIRARVRGDGGAYRSALEETAEGFARSTEAADVAGRRRISLLARRAELDAPEREREAAEEIGAEAEGLVPAVEFRQAVADIVARVPEVAPGWEATAEVYTRHGFACARATDEAVAARVQGVLAETIADGSVPNPRKVIAELTDWKRSYVDTVFETNIRTAYTAGMWSRIEEPNVARVLVGMRFVSALMATTRPNHAAAHGLTAPSDSYLWDVYSPPLGFRCACALREVSIFEAREKRLLDAEGRMLTVYPPNFAAAAPDPGFGQGRPDRALRAGTI